MGRVREVNGIARIKNAFQYEDLRSGSVSYSFVQCNPVIYDHLKQTTLTKKLPGDVCAGDKNNQYPQDTTIT